MRTWQGGLSAEQWGENYGGGFVSLIVSSARIIVLLSFYKTRSRTRFQRVKNGQLRWNKTSRIYLCATSFHYVLLCNLFLNRFPGLHLLRVNCGLIKNHLAHNGWGDYLFEEHTCFDSLDLDVKKKSNWMQGLCDFRHLDTDQPCVFLFISTEKKYYRHLDLT